MVDDTETQTPFDSPDSQIDEVVDATRDVPSRLHAAHIGRAVMNPHGAQHKMQGYEYYR